MNEQETQVALVCDEIRSAGFRAYPVGSRGKILVTLSSRRRVLWTEVREALGSLDGIVSVAPDALGAMVTVLFACLPQGDVS